MLIRINSKNCSIQLLQTVQLLMASPGNVDYEEMPDLDFEESEHILESELFKLIFLSSSIFRVRQMYRSRKKQSESESQSWIGNATVPSGQWTQA